MRGFVRILEVVFAFTLIFIVLTNIQTNMPPRYEDTNDMQRLNQLAGDIASSICNSDDFRYDLVRNMLPINRTVRIDQWTEKVKEDQATYPKPLNAINGTARQSTELNMSAEKIRLCVNTLNATNNVKMSVCERDDDISCKTSISLPYTITGITAAGTHCTEWFNFTLNSSKVYVMSLYSTNLQNITYQDNGKNGMYFHANFDDTQNTSDITNHYTDYSNNPVEMYVETLHDMKINNYLPTDLNYKIWLYSNSTANWKLDDEVNSTGSSKTSKAFSMRVTLSGLGANVTLLNNTYTNGTIVSENLSSFNGTKLTTATANLPLTETSVNTTIIFQNTSYDSRATSVEWLIDGVPIKTQSINLVGDLLNNALVNDSSLVSYWRFEQNPLADEKSLNNLTVTGGTHNTTGKFGSGYSFNSSGYAYAADSASLNITTNITVFGWVKTNMGGDYVGIVAKDYSYHILKDAAGKIEGDIWLNGNKMEIHSSKVINDGTWHSFALTYDGGYVKLYVDGVRDEGACWKQGPGYVTCPIYNESIIRKYAGPLYIGQGYAGRKFNGTVDDIAIFNKALSASEILGLNSTELSKSDLANDANLVSYWRFEGGADEKGKNNGTIIDATYNSSGRYEGAYSFNGAGEYTRTLHSSELSSDNQTVSFWFKPTTTPPYGNIQGMIFKAPSTGYNRDISIYLTTNGKISSWLGNSTLSQFKELNSTTIVSAGNWYHVTVVKENGSIYWLYINGILEASDSTAWIAGKTTAPIDIGGSPNLGSSRYFNGEIDDVSVFNRALTDSEIAGLYGSMNFADIQLPYYDDSNNPKATASCIISGYEKEYAPKKIVVGVWNK